MPDVHLLDAQRRRSCAAAGEASTARIHRAHGSSEILCACAGESSGAFSFGLPLILPCDAQKLWDSGSGDALMQDVHLVEAVRDCFLPIAST